MKSDKMNSRLRSSAERIEQMLINLGIPNVQENKTGSFVMFYNKKKTTKVQNMEEPITYGNQGTNK